MGCSIGQRDNSPLPAQPIVELPHGIPLLRAAR